jgi:hypothetical protein
MDIKISERAAENFLSDLQSVLTSMDSQDIDGLYLYSRKRDAIAVSYDRSLRPFVGRTTGFNPEDKRVRQLDASLYLVQMVGLGLRIAGRPGGRVFLTSDGAFCIQGGERVQLMNWEWPGRDLVREVVSLLEEATYSVGDASG